MMALFAKVSKMRELSGCFVITIAKDCRRRALVAGLSVALVVSMK